MSLATNVAGLELKNPIIVAAGTRTLSSRHLIKCYMHGAAGAVTKTITFDVVHRVQPKPRMYILMKDSMLRGDWYSFYSIELMSEIAPEKWINEIKRVKREAEEFLVIASIAGRTVEEWEELVDIVNQSNADGIELNLSCPHIERGKLMGRAVVEKPKVVEEIIKVVKSRTDLPVIGKLTPHGASPLTLAEIMNRAGVDAVVSTARFRGLIIDVDEMKPILWKWYGGYGGPWQVPISVAWTAQIAKTLPDMDVIGSGGIHSGRDVLQFILAGASAVQICTVVIVEGYKSIDRILAELKSWTNSKGVDLSMLRGRALEHMLSLESLERRRVFSVIVDDEKCSRCGICIETCPYNAIYLDEQGRVRVDESSCDNCALCINICPRNAMSMRRVR